MVSGVFKAAIASGFVAISNLLTGCDSSVENPPPITAEQLLEVLPHDELVPLQSLVGVDPNSMICILVPYQDRLAGDRPNASLINQYLESVGFVGSEGDWLIVWVVDNVVSYTDIRIKEFSPISMWEIERDSSVKPFDGFNDVHCSPVSEALLYRTEFKNKVWPEGYPGLLILKRSVQ
jgi:hypothetical protein